MTPTDDERREVAKRLRESDRKSNERHPVEWFSEHKTKSTWLVLNECLEGRELDFVSAEDCGTQFWHPLARLADLIDPDGGDGDE